MAENTLADSYYHIEPLPGAIEDTDAALDLLASQGWELLETNGRNAIFKSRVISTSTNADSFGRNRVSIPHTLGDYKHLYAVDYNFVDYFVSGGLVTHNVNRSSVTLQTSASAASRAVHQTKMYHNYMPGKSQYIMSSFRFGAAEPGVIKRTGYFDDYNGIFLEQDQTGSLSWVIRSATNGTGSLQENRVAQADWNLNPLLSGHVVLDMTKAQLAWIDFQWLSIGRVRCGFVINGENIICHVFDHANKVDGAYMQNPNLPVRCEIRNTTTATGSMEQICATVASEGGYEESGTTYAHTSVKLRPLSGSESALVMAVRLKNSYNGLPNRAFVRLEDTSVYTEDQTVKYIVVKLDSGSVSGGTWFSEDSGSVVEWNSGSMAYDVSKAHEMLNGFAAAGTAGGGGGPGTGFSTTSQRQNTKTKNNYIAQNYDSTASEMYGIVVTNLTGTNTDVIASMVWKEVY